MIKKRVIRESTYYVLVATLLLFIAFLSYFLTPLMIIGSSFLPYLVTLTIAVLLGWFVSIFIRDLDYMTHHHHSALLLVVIAGAFINFIVVILSLQINYDILSTQIANPYIISALFAIGFLIPYLVLLKNE